MLTISNISKIIEKAIKTFQKSEQIPEIRKIFESLEMISVQNQIFLNDI